MAKERIGILESAFDPIHQGHISMAQAAMEHFRLSHMLFIPVGTDAYKTCIASGEDRWKMVVSACTQDIRLIPSRAALDLSGPTYTVDILLLLKKEHPKAEFFYLLGADGVMKLHKWHRLPEVFPLCTFLVYPRAGEYSPREFNTEKKRLTEMGAKIRMIPVNPFTISSTEIRSQLSQGQPTPFLYSPVREFCTLRGLYGADPHLDPETTKVWLDKLFSALNPRRFTHSVSVAGTARRLARIHSIDPDQSEQGGLLHDCAKCLPMKQMQRIAREHSLTDDPDILSSNGLLHSLVGAWVARNTYGMADPEVLDAISFHNTGRPGMSRLSMCVCLSDYMEPTRDSYPLMENVRILSELSLERALLMSLEGTASYVRSKGKYLHPRTQETIDWLKTLPGVRSSR